MSERKVYNQEERERIRRLLLQYKLRYNIGCPTFAQRIHDANPHIKFIDQRRLSRFLAKQHKPEDMFIGWCETFLESIPDDLGDPLESLADGLLKFCGTHPGPDYAGHYSLALKSSLTAQPDLPSAEWSVAVDDGFWRIEERPVNRHIIADGVLVNTAGSGIALLKDRLTGMTRTIVLFRQDNALLGQAQGVGMTRSFGSYLFHLDKRL